MKQTFDDYYSDFYPNWKLIKSRLKQKNYPILRFQKKNENKLRNIFEKNNLSFKKLSFYQNAIHWPKEAELGIELPGQNLFYLQNASSLLPVLALDPQQGEKILDSCAAPGGKASFLSESGAKLTVNDSSMPRMNRLLQVFDELKLTQPTYHTGNAAILFKRYPEHFDKILLDAPCSSEKHVINSEKYLAQWKPGRVKGICNTQLSLINGLVRALKPGGRMVYSTCSINPKENELLIEKFLKKHAEKCKVINYPTSLPGSQENSAYGKIDLENTENFDPMFIAIIQKNGL